MGAFTRLFGKSPRVVLVEAFAENPDDELSVPEIVALTDVSRRAAYMHIQTLVKEGILIKSGKKGKCQYYRFNEVDPRGEALVFLENILILGDLESRIKRDEGIAPEMPFPYPRRFDPGLVYGPKELRIPLKIPQRLIQPETVSGAHELSEEGPEASEDRIQSFVSAATQMHLKHGMARLGTPPIQTGSTTGGMGWSP